MSRLFSQARSYTPLDDEYDDGDTAPLHHSAEDTQHELGEGQSWFVKTWKQLRWPRINYSTIWASLNLTSSRRRVLCEVTLCFLCVSAVLTLCSYLGYYTLFVHKPAPVIDKSYSAFRIPNHEASLNYGALKNAERNQTSFEQIQYSSLMGVTKKHRSTTSPSGTGHASKIKWRDSWNDIIGGKPGGKYSILKKRRKRSANRQKLKSRQTRSIYGNSFLEARSQYVPKWKMQVVFMTAPNENIFTKERLKKVHEIEMKIMKHKKYSDFCYKEMTISNDPAVKALNGCTPLNSLLTYFYPSKDGKGNVFYDGLGDNMDNMESALKWAMTSTHFYYYVDDKVNSSYMKSQLLRTEVLFGAPLKGDSKLTVQGESQLYGEIELSYHGFNNPYSNRDVQSKKFKEFVVTYIDLLSKESTDEISVLYGGKEIFDYEVESTFWNDIRLAIYALISIFLLMLLLTSGSIWLTTWGLISILLSAPLAIFFYRVVFKVVGLGILNGAAAFVIIGIGVDDVFVFINVFRQATHLKEARARTLYTIKTAGKSTFFTSFTTAAAFAANIASMIPAVHDFGLFMSLIVANCWITVMLVMPPVLYIWHISFRICEEKVVRCLFSCLPSRSSSSSLSLPEDVAQFMDSSHGSITHVTLSREVTDEDADVPMLSMDAPIQYIDDDEDMILVDPDPLIMPDEVDTTNKERNYLGSGLQAVLYHFMVVPLIKARWVILAISFIVLCVSIGFMTQLHASTKPPQFFREDTNMQKLLDLKARFSAIDTVQCYRCNAMYSIGQKKVTAPPRQAEWHTQATTTSTESFTKAVTTNNSKPTTTTAKPYVPSKWATVAKQPYYPPKTERVSTPKPESVPENFDVCKDRDCSHPKKRPLLESGATVYVVVGIKDFHWRQKDVQHVMSEDMGELHFDTAFSSMFNFSNPEILSGMAQLCSLCKRIAQNTKLVRNGSAQCLPAMDRIPYMVRKMLIESVEECKDLPVVGYIYGNEQPAHALGGLTADGSAILWLAFAFESMTSKGQSYFEAYKEYQQWEEFLSNIKQEMDPNTPLQDMFQTSEFWPEVLMEIVAVNSAIYSVVLSMIICMVAVTIFTRHILLLLVIFISIAEMVCVVVAIFYVLGWEIGGVEAISLSILVGSSVDYCVHLVEGYILAAQACPVKDNAVKARHWRTSVAFSHIGVSIISSALTTIIAAVPLTQTTIQPFAKFGQIIAINTSVCILYSLTVCTALLSTLAPAFFKPSWKSTLKAFVGTLIAGGSVVLIMFIMTKAGIEIPGPNGGSLFSK